ncbi:PTS sugar transporter subunit IIC [Macrococcus animalis]|uniref:PTS sugar transporter subunit IIC n=1 Tax=Macrococcus animalis TaxID=3395467 RepID=UPI0039BF8B96
MTEKVKKQSYFMNRMEKGAGGISAAILVSLGIGLLLKSVGGLFHIDLLVMIGTIATYLMTPALGGAIAVSLGANGLTIVSSMISAAIGGNAITQAGDSFNIVTGEPIGAILAAIIATFVGKKVTGKTFLDLMAVPLSSVLAGSIAGFYLSKIISPTLITISKFITSTVGNQPLVTSVVIAIVFAVLVMTPASSAALAVALQLDPHASSAALVGISAQFVGYTAMSFKENDLGGFLAQSICTPKVQFPNIVKNPSVTIAPLIAAAVAGPVAVLVFDMKLPYEIAGLGLCALIAPIQILNAQGLGVLMQFIIAGIIVPLIVTLLVHYLVMKPKRFVKTGDLHLEVN